MAILNHIKLSLRRKSSDLIVHVAIKDYAQNKDGH